MTASFRFILLRWPQTARAQAILHEELERGFTGELFPAAKSDFDDEVSDWLQKPRFYQSYQHAPRRFSWFFRVHREEEGGQHWWWVNFGTGLEGPRGSTYPIVPVQAPALKFVVPYQPKTFPPAGLRYNPTAPPRFITTLHVDHPGIQARDWSTTLFHKYVRRGQRYGFHDVVYRAGARAWARI